MMLGPHEFMSAPCIKRDLADKDGADGFMSELDGGGGLSW